jgi:hypothetical protein
VHLGWHFNKEGRLEQGEETPEQSALYAEGNAYATLIGGFTSVQSVGPAIDGDLRDLINAGVIPGPRILTSLRAATENTGSPEKTRAYVRKMKEDGADVIKLFASFDRTPSQSGVHVDVRRHPGRRIHRVHHLRAARGPDQCNSATRGCPR